MTLEQLRVFVAVAERQHVTQAARALNLSQSAASGAIAALEGRYGVRLFDRVGRRIELTAAGRVLLDDARAVLARVGTAELRLAELGGETRGTLAVWASQTVGAYWLPRQLATFRVGHPGVTPKVSIGNTAQVAAAVREGEAELGFVEGVIEDADLDLRPVAQDLLVLVVGVGHHWFGRPQIDYGDLTDTEWVLREPGSGTRAAFETAIVAAGHDPSALEVALELPSNEAVRSAVEAGMGATVISAAVASPSLEAGLLGRVGFAISPRTYCAVRHRARASSRAAEALLAMVVGGRGRIGGPA